MDKPTIPRTPRAPQGPSDAELNYVPPDPYLPPFGGTSAQLADLVCSYGMQSDLTSSTVVNVSRRKGY